MEQNQNKIDRILSETWNTFIFEIRENFKAITSYDFWLYVFSGISLVSVIFNKNTLALISLLFLIVIKFKSDYAAGKVTDYVRTKKGIPNKNKIKRMKNAV